MCVLVSPPAKSEGFSVKRKSVLSLSPVACDKSLFIIIIIYPTPPSYVKAISSF